MTRWPEGPTEAGLRANEKGTPLLLPPSQQTALVFGTLLHPATYTYVIIILFVLGIGNGAKSHSGCFELSGLIINTHVGPAILFTVIETELGCAPVLGTGSAVNVGAAQREVERANKKLANTLFT